MGEQCTTATSTPSTANLSCSQPSVHIRQFGATPRTTLIDELLDERLATRPDEGGTWQG